MANRAFGRIAKQARSPHTYRGARRAAWIAARQESPAGKKLPWSLWAEQVPAKVKPSKPVRPNKRDRSLLARAAVQVFRGVLKPNPHKQCR